jgi:hypothetical protein
MSVELTRSVLCEPSTFTVCESISGGVIVCLMATSIYGERFRAHLPSPTLLRVPSMDYGWQVLILPYCQQQTSLLAPGHVLRIIRYPQNLDSSVKASCSGTISSPILTVDDHRSQLKARPTSVPGPSTKL